MSTLKDFYYRYLRYFLAKDYATATSYDKYLALSYAVRSQMVDNWIVTQKMYHENNVRRVYYLSMEYILGKSLRQNIVNMGIEKSVIDVGVDLGFSLEELVEKEDDFELGNGGKGRLAACFIDSMASAALPAIGYGLRYDFGLYRQEISNGQQIEEPYDWLHKGHPWEIIRPQYSCEVEFLGESHAPAKGKTWREWINTEKAIAIPYDIPIPGYKNSTVNTLRLWSARSAEVFKPDYQHHGDYIRACEEMAGTGTLTNILFPEEDVLRATEQRLKQQFFLVSASLKDIVRRFKVHNKDITDLDKKVVIQLNGTRCALAIPELMRMLLDIEQLTWERAWSIVENVFAYTSHAVGKDDLEAWPVYMMTQIFPRHMEIINEINARHLERISKTDKGKSVISDLSLIEEGEVKRIRMSHLAVIGSFAVNGVSKIQTDMLKSDIYPKFFNSTPNKFVSITNGVAHRRWLLSANRPLAGLITETIGDGWITDSSQLRKLELYKNKNDFLFMLDDIKHSAKKNLASVVKQTLDITINPNALFDVQCTRIHLPKRQLLHFLNVVSRYLRIKNGEESVQNRVHIFAGKAAPSDHLAKQMVHLINIFADIINNDPQMENNLRVVFIPDYGITWAEHMIPAADIAEQLSIPLIEASGTSNMKFALNGAVILASWSGANIELSERLGNESILTFGKKKSEYPQKENYYPSEILEHNAELKEIINFIESTLSAIPDGPSIYPLLSSLRDIDDQYILYDYDDYTEKQHKIDLLYKKRLDWLQKCLLNIARSGWFSSDRTISEYENNIWKVALP
ncbi:MAG: glycogen/starch/alpha-glucan family phosphorylase [Chitinivibrionales bacterium]|nr:glycogen/starch/alpha-glucan family phosphorylase [Chitinivibrionales bacterium]